MEAKLNPNKFEEMVTPLYAQIKEIESQINAIGLQALAECYEILSKNPKGNCILINPDSEDLVLNQENFAIWAIGAFDGTIHVKTYTENMMSRLLMTNSDQLITKMHQDTMCAHSMKLLL